MKKTIKITQKGLNYLAKNVKEATSQKDREERLMILGAALFNVKDGVVIPYAIEQYAESVAVDGVIDNDEHILEIGKMYYNMVKFVWGE